MRPWYTTTLEQGDASVRAKVAEALAKQRKREPADYVGRVVEFMRGGRHRCGLVRKPRGKARSLYVLDQEGTETWVSFRKVVDISKERLGERGRHDIVQALRETDRRRTELRGEIELQAVWELAREEPGKRWTREELFDLYFGGEYESDRRAAFARVVDEGRYFIRHLDKYAPRDPEQVEQLLDSARHRRQGESKRQETAEWLREVADRETEGQRPDIPVLVPDAAERAKAIQLLEDTALYGSESATATEAAELIRRAHLHGPRAAFDLLVKLGHWSPDENLELHRSTAPVAFSDQAIKASKTARPGEWGRRWWSGTAYGFSDDELCDKAFSIRRSPFGYTVGVHLAEPSAVFRESELILQEALGRGATISLPEGSIEMLPERIRRSAGLTTREYRTVLTVSAKFRRSLELTSYRIALRRVRLKEIFQGRQADDALDENRSLGNLRILASALRARRQDAGELVLHEPNVRFLADRGRVEMDLEPANSVGSLVTLELVRLAQELVARFCIRKRIPVIYWVEPAPGPKSPEYRVDKYRAETYRADRVHAQRKLLSRAVLQVEVPDRIAPRVALGRPMDHVADLITHRQLATYLRSGAAAYPAGELEQHLANSRMACEEAARVARSGRRYWLLKKLEEYVGKSVEVVVLERVGTGLLVELTLCPVKVLIEGGRESWASPGDLIRATVNAVSARRDTIVLTNPRPLSHSA